MTQRILPLATLAILAAFTGACDDGTDSQTLREKIAAGLAENTVPLAEAIATAEADAAGTAIEAKLEVEHGAPVYRVEVIGASGQTRVEIDPQSGDIVRSKPASSGNDEDNAANAEFATGADWAALVAAAEAAASGEAFEIESDDGVFEAKVMVDLVVFEIEMSADGAILKQEQSDDFDDEIEDEDEDEDDEPTDGANDDGGGDDPNDGANDDGGGDDPNDGANDDGA